MKQGQVTVMVPSYNYAHFLEECVASAATQEGVDVDVVIVDNGSTDGSVELGAELAARYDNVRHVVKGDNQGIITSFNRCRDEVRGEYAVLLCADDALTPGSLRRSVDALRRHPNVGLLYGPVLDFLKMDEVRPEQLAGEPGRPMVYGGRSWVTTRCRIGTNPVRTPEAIMRASVMKTVGYLDTSLPFTSDLNMWLRMAVVADVAFLPGPPQALYRRHPDNFGNTYLLNRTAKHDIEQRWRAFDSFLAGVADRAAADRWGRQARRTLASEARYLATRAYVRLEDDVREAEVAELLDFAESIDPGGVSPLEALGWKLRRSLGPGRSVRFPAFLPRATYRWARREYVERRRVTRGI